MKLPKWDVNGIRYRDEEEMNQIMNDIQEYVDTNNKESLRRYNDIWDRISTEKGFDDDSVYDLIDRLDTDSKIFIYAGGNRALTHRKERNNQKRNPAVGLNNSDYLLYLLSLNSNI